MKIETDELYVYKFKLSFYGPYNKSEGKCKYHQHSGKIFAESNFHAYMKLLNEFTDLYDSEKEEDSKETLDFESISIKEYCDITGSLIMWDKEDEYYGV